jgi:hypothetical protein
MQVQRQSNGEQLTLDVNSALGTGGEARIYSILEDKSLVAKIYHTPTADRGRKLDAMMANPPDDPMQAHGHISIAWPIDLLRAVHGQRRVVGFLMPRVAGMRPLFEYYNPLTRRQQCPLFNYRYLLRTAHNLAAVVGALHARGYVIGDMNESNILVTDTALVTFVDTDSFQVRASQTGAVYRCPVGKPEYTPPELQGRAFAQLDREPEHDLFGLAVLLFQLLMEGTHPFAGVFQGRGDPPPYEARIAAGHFPYCRERHGPYRPMPSAPPSNLFPANLRELFLRCFVAGHSRPQARPDAQKWQYALQEAEQTLISCVVNDQHLYGRHLQTCPWCERTARLGGRDPFPSRQAVRGGHHLRPVSSTPKPRSASRAATVSARRSAQPAPTQPLRLAALVAPSAHTPAGSTARRPSRLGSTCSGVLWGAISGATVGAIVFALTQRDLGPQVIPAALLGALQTAAWGAAWGMAWGGMWGVCRLPASTASSGRSSRLKGIITGAILGTLLGSIASLVVGAVPGSSLQLHQSPVLEVLTGIQEGTLIPALRAALRESMANAPSYALPGALIGAILGVVWGACRR